MPQRRSGAARRRRAGIIDEVPAGRLYKDGALLVDAQARTVADRAGGWVSPASVSVALALTDKGELAADPELELIGIPESDATGEPMARDRLRCRGRGRFRRRCRSRAGAIPKAVAEAVRRAVRARPSPSAGIRSRSATCTC